MVERGKGMEYLDIYDEDGKHLGKKTRELVHKNALWHKTVHCWLYDRKGNIYFQIRKDEGTYYTTASGHVKAGESLEEGFGREIKEEIGIDVDIKNCKLVNVVKFKMDKEKNGEPFRDRAFANVYVCDFEGKIGEFNFDKDEVLGLVKVDAVQTLELFKKGAGSINGEKILYKNGENTIEESEIRFEDFLVNPHETALTKYGEVLEKVISLTN